MDHALEHCASTPEPDWTIYNSQSHDYSLHIFPVKTLIQVTVYTSSLTKILCQVCHFLYASLNADFSVCDALCDSCFCPSFLMIVLHYFVFVWSIDPCLITDYRFVCWIELSMKGLHFHPLASTLWRTEWMCVICHPPNSNLECLSFSSKHFTVKRAAFIYLFFLADQCHLFCFLKKHTTCK